MPDAKVPPRADRMRVAACLNYDARRLREYAEDERKRAEKIPELARVLTRSAAIREAKAKRFERVARWMVQ